MGNGYVVFPPAGNGVYHNIEAQAARDFVSKWQLDGAFKLGKAIRLKHPYDYPLHDYIIRRAKQRLDYKHKHDFAHIPIKLGLNSLYGKLAQRPQYLGHHPIYRELLGAGYITAHTRAQLLQTVDPASVVLFSTDSVKSLTPLVVDKGEGLGQWETSKWTHGLFILAGLYGYHDESGWHDKTRGFRKFDVKAQFRCFRAMNRSSQKTCNSWASNAI
jgi:hypothetical protein